MKRVLAQKRWARVLLAVCITAVLLAGLCLGGYVLGHRYIQANGITLKASRDVPPVTVPVYLQNDPQWAQQTIGESDTTMGAAGCLISCVAMAMNDMGMPVTPPQLNQAMTAVGGYDHDEFIWLKVKEAFPGLDYKYSRIFSGGTIQRWLEQGLLPIVKVKYKGGGAQHWVLVVGAADGDFLVIDPLNEQKEPVPLNATHGKVYAWRVLVREG